MSGRAKCTPLPWRFDPDTPGPPYRILAEQGPITVCPAIAHGFLDAAFIVRAVNSHTALVDALVTARGWMFLSDRGGFQQHYEDMRLVDAVLALARADQT
jgi:hypothetical protein